MHSFNSVLLGIYVVLICLFRNFENGVEWFRDGKINACVNAVDRHAATDPDRIALIYEADNSADSYEVTYGELHEEVCRFSNWLSTQRYLKPGSIVSLYMPMIPATVVAMLACARLGIFCHISYNFILFDFFRIGA